MNDLGVAAVQRHVHHRKCVERDRPFRRGVVEYGENGVLEPFLRAGEDPIVERLARNRDAGDGAQVLDDFGGGLGFSSTAGRSMIRAVMFRATRSSTSR